jgi:hypothetical protein
MRVVVGPSTVVGAPGMVMGVLPWRKVMFQVVQVRTV